MNYIEPWRRQIASLDPLDVMLADIAVRIQLSATDYQKAEQHYEAISAWIHREESPLHGLVELVYPQGGFAIGATVARHATDDEFDIDGMAQLTVPANVDPEVPLSLLHEAIRGPAGSRYHKMTDRKTRCVTVSYVGMHLDLTPTVRILGLDERTGLIFHSKLEEPQNRTALWANPYGFAEWFKAMTPADEAFGRFFEERSLEYARVQAQMLVSSDTQIYELWRHPVLRGVAQRSGPGVRADRPESERAPRGRGPLDADVRWVSP
jgi:hypothetical protein